MWLVLYCDILDGNSFSDWNPIALFANKENAIQSVRITNSERSLHSWIDPKTKAEILATDVQMFSIQEVPFFNQPDHL